MTHFQQSEQRCCQCDSDDQLFVSLSCEHSFCIVCMCYVMIKSKTKKSEENLVACPICEQTTSLDPESIEAIQHTIENIILPKLSNFSIEELSTQNIDNIEEYERQHGRSNKKITGQTNIPSNKLTVQKPSIKISKRFSQDPFYDNLSPTTNKYFFSKCMTPINNSRDSFNNKECCSSHPLQQITSICLTCQNELICTKCLLTTKHKGHNVKLLSKGVQFLVEQINFKKLDLNHKIQNLQLNQKRIKGKLQFLKDRIGKSQQNITQSFDQLISYIKRKQNQLHNQCYQMYQSIQDGLQNQLDVITEQTSILNFAKQNIQMLLMSSGKHYDFLKSYPQVCSLMNRQFEEYSFKPQIQFQSNNYLQISEEDLAQVIEEINSITFQGRKLQNNKMITMSTKRLGAFVSCHTSKQKDKKKNLKTEQSSKYLMKKKSLNIHIPKIQTNQLTQFSTTLQKQMAHKSLYYTDRSVDASKNSTFCKNSMAKMLSTRNLLQGQKKIKNLQKERSEKKVEKQKQINKTSTNKILDIKRKKRV